MRDHARATVICDNEGPRWQVDLPLQYIFSCSPPRKVAEAERLHLDVWRAGERGRAVAGC